MRNHTFARTLWKATAGLLFVHGVISGQRLSLGFVGGTPLTRDFPISRVYTGQETPGFPAAFDWFSDKRSFLAGLSVEVGLGKGLSLEANALHRNLHLQMRDVFAGGTSRYLGEVVPGTWEWPVLAKYRLPPVGAARPFLEGGPSFRTRHNPAPAEPSQFGATIGAGVEFRLGLLRISPALRYTRWQYDGDYPRAATKRDQIEFVTGISYAAPIRHGRLWNGRLGLGVIGGLPLTGGFEEMRRPERLDEARGYAVGLAAELKLSRRLSIELDGLYRPLRAHSYGAVFVQGELVPGESAFEFTVLTWQLPVPAKYRFRPDARVRPVIEAGPSFRAAGNVNGYNPSRYGFTAGGGIEMHHKTMKISPVARYTRWAKDPPGAVRSASTASNQVELLCSFIF
ncbi:MAG: PorT family protein [Bryobacterales bacterium]|nr:PorT family protein [Bryobacterales bacterium]